MAIIYNSNLTKEIIDGTKLSTAAEIVPNQIADKVVSTMEVNPKLLRYSDIVRNVGSTSTGTTTIHTTETDRYFFMTNATLSVMKDATCDNTAVLINVYIDKVQRQIFCFAFLTATAAQETVSLTFNPPIRIDRGTIIDITGTHSTGTITKRASIVGYNEQL